MDHLLLHDIYFVILYSFFLQNNMIKKNIFHQDLSYFFNSINVEIPFVTTTLSYENSKLKHEYEI